MDTTPPVRLLYFAWLRERIGIAAESCVLPAGVTDVAALISWLSTRSPGHAAAFANRAVIRAAVNQAFASPGGKIAPGDEIAFFPPITGG